MAVTDPKQLQRQKSLREKYKSLGLCVKCGKEATHGQKCDACFEKEKEYSKKINEKRRAEGKCLMCGKGCLPELLDKKRPLCLVCYLKVRAKQRLGDAQLWSILLDKLEKQNYRCAYTGEEIILGINDSVVHIYPVFKYKELANDANNIEWVTREINEMKRDRTPEEFISLIKKILDYRRQP